MIVNLSCEKTKVISHFQDIFKSFLLVAVSLPSILQNLKTIIRLLLCYFLNIYQDAVGSPTHDHRQTRQMLY